MTAAEDVIGVKRQDRKPEDLEVRSSRLRGTPRLFLRRLVDDIYESPAEPFTRGPFRESRPGLFF